MRRGGRIPLPLLRLRSREFSRPHRSVALGRSLRRLGVHLPVIFPSSSVVRAAHATVAAYLPCWRSPVILSQGVPNLEHSGAGSAVLRLRFWSADRCQDRGPARLPSLAPSGWRIGRARASVGAPARSIEHGRNPASGERSDPRGVQRRGDPTPPSETTASPPLRGPLRIHARIAAREFVGRLVCDRRPSRLASVAGGCCGSRTRCAQGRITAGMNGEGLGLSLAGGSGSARRSDPPWSPRYHFFVAIERKIVFRSGVGMVDRLFRWFWRWSWAR